MLTKVQIKNINITILCLAITIVLYPYISPVFYKLFGSSWGDSTHKVTGIPSAYDNITLDVKNFNYSITHFTKISFINPSAYIVIFTAYGNILFRLIYLYFFKHIKVYQKVLWIDLSINFLLVAFFWYSAISIWLQQYHQFHS